MTFADVKNKTWVDTQFSPTDRNSIYAAMQRAYDGSPIARKMFDDWISDPNKKIEIHFTTGPLGANGNTGQVAFNFSKLPSARYIDNNGKAVQETVESALVHELVHALSTREDDITATDYKGATVEFANTIFKQLEIPEQNSYIGYDSRGLLTPSFQYTNGAAIDRSVVANRDRINWNSSFLGNSRDLLIGDDGRNNTLSAGNGRDFLYGNGGDDTLDGGNGNDMLFGGLDDDTLVGGDGSDMQDGGSGIDTYTFSGTWGNDVIMDSDGLGNIVVDTVTLTGGKKTSANTYLSADGKYSYQRNTNGSLVIHQKDSNNAITIRDWSQGVGKLGITLDDTPFDPTKPEERGVQMLKGDQRAPIVGGGNGLSSYDWTQTSRAPDGTLVGGVAEANFADVLKAGSTGSVIYGYGGNDALGGGAGVDDIFGGDGNDLIGGGAGADNIRGGAGNDRIHSGGTVSAYDRLYVGEIWGDPRYRSPLKPGETVVSAEATYGVYKDVNGVSLLWGMSLDAAQAEGDTVDGGAGDDIIYATDARDTLDGGADKDTIYGLGGADQIAGGSGDDVLSGDGAGVERDASGYWRYDYTNPALHGSDVIDGGAGDDVIVGGGGEDQLVGGADSDTIHGDDIASNLSAQYHGSDVIFGDGGEDFLFGDGGDDLLFGGDGDDLLDGGTGADYLDGGSGSNTYYVDNVGDVIVGPGAVVQSSAQMFAQSAPSAERVTAQVNGESVQSVEASISYTLGDGLGNLTLTGSDSINGTGNALHNKLIGNAGNNELAGGDGHDRLESGAGNDTLDGGTGNDTFVVAATGGVKHIVDASGVDVLLLQDWKVSNLQVSLQGGSLVLSDGLSGTQVFMAGVDGNFTAVDSYQLQDDVGNAVNLTASQMLAMGGGQVGTADNDTIMGTAVDDVIDALGGADIVHGAGGNDVLRGSGGFDKLYGDAGNDTLIGGAASGGDVSRGDELYGGEGSDTLSDGQIMDGGAGADVYKFSGINHGNLWGGIFDSPTVIGNAGGGDIVQIGGGFGPDDIGVTRGHGINQYSYDISLTNKQTGQVIRLQAQTIGTDATAPISAVHFDSEPGVVWTASDLRNFANTGDARNNRLWGYDSVVNALNGNAGDDYLVGGNLADTLDGGTGNDSLAGGLGKDTYLFALDSGSDFVTDKDGVNGNVVQLAAGLKPADLRLMRVSQNNDGSTPGNDSLVLMLDATGARLWINEFFQPNAVGTVSEIRFNDEASTVWRYSDILTKAGVSVTGTQNTQTGTAADDTFNVDNPQDMIVEASDGGSDSVNSTVSYTLPTNVENLQLIGPAATMGTGNAQDNILRGNDLDNVLTGRGGNDQYFGGKGNDTYWDVTGSFDAPSNPDRTVAIVENANEGYDTLYTTAFAMTMPDNVEQLVVMSPSPGGSWRGMVYNFTGNALDNVIDLTQSQAQGDFKNRIDGGAGSDVMTGSRMLFDTYVVDSVGDVVNEIAANGGEVEASISYSLGQNLVNLKLTGSTAISGTGTQLNNILDGSANTAANVLTGLGGDDTYRVGALDTVVEAAGGGNDRVVVVGLVPGSPNPAVQVADWANVEAVELDFDLGDVNLAGDSGNNVLVGSRGANTIDGLDGDDTLSSLKVPQVYGGYNLYSDVVDHLNGGNGNDTIYSRGGGDVVDGGAGNDTIGVEKGRLTKVDGGAGDDSISLTQSLDVTVNGGAGDDVVVSDNGAGMYVMNVQFGVGSGNDTVSTGAIRTAASWAATPAILSKITLLPGTDASSLRFNRSGANLVLSLAGGTDSLTVSNFFENATSSAIQSVVDTVVLADGTVLTRDSIAAALGKTDWQTATAGNDLLMASAANHTLAGGAGDDTLIGHAGADQLDGGTGNDQLTAGDGVDQLIGGVGDDALSGGRGADSYTFSAGWGHDLVDDKLWAPRAGVANAQLADDGTVDSIDFDATVTAADIAATISGRDLLLTHKTTGDSVLLLNYFAQTEAQVGPPTRQDVSIRFADSTVWDQIFIDHLVSTVTGTDGDDTLYASALGGETNGLAGNDILFGGAGIDQLNGGVGVDQMYGGLGNDTYVVDDVGDVVEEYTSEGTDLVQSNINYTLGANLEDLTLTGTANINATGNSLANVLTGNSGNNTLSGGTGADTMKGGAGDDTYVVDNAGDVVTENAGEGLDLVQSKVTYTLAANVENLTLTGTSAINATGNADGNTLTGNSAINVLTGGAGDDILDGKAGSDTLVGGAGNDSYVVDVLTDVVTELADEGTDTVSTGITYTLGVNLENLSLTGASTINGTGNAAANVITGNTANNVLDGAAGNDVYLIGPGGGQDTIQEASADASAGKLNVLRFGTGVNSASAILKRVGADLVVTFTPNTNKVTVKSFYLNADSSNTSNPVQRIEFVDGGISWDLATIDQKVNAANTINGTAGADTLTGTAATDVINGLAGNDTIDGGGGADTMVGGTGNDSYKVDNVGDVVTELASEGTDLVTAAVSYTLAANVENLTLSGTGSTNATGNDLANKLTGNTGSNVLDGGAGADTLVGGAGHDTYYVDNTADVTTEAASAGTDLVIASVNWTLAANLENLTLAGTGNLNGTGNTGANTITGNAGDNILDGGTGIDNLKGGAGNDTYIVDVATDTITENLNEGVDTVKSAATYTLGANLENLTLTGTTAINGTGNGLNNTLIGNSGKNTLTGGAGDDVLDGGVGIDTLKGGTGNDSYFLDVSTDVATENANEGTDTINAAFSHTLSANLENLTLTGSTAINGTGNASANVLVGNTGVNTLTGNAGDDTLDGKAGADSLIGGTGNDTYKLGRGYGADTITENDLTLDNTDIAQFGADITMEQLWFQKVGNNLQVDVIGTSDKFTLNNWYLGNQYHVEQFKISDGQVLLDSQVQALVQAMAAFSPPAAGQTTLAADYAAALNPVFAANWN